MAAPADALLFDLGGVIMGIDFERCFASWSSDSGVPTAVLRSRHAFEAAYERHERGEASDAEFFAALGRMLGIELDEARWAAGWNALFTAEIAPVVELVARVKDRVPVYAFSNTNAMHQRVWSRRFAPALANFREVFVSHELGARKPERAAFEEVARRIGVAPPRILFFDDTRTNVEGARAAGLQSVWVREPQDVADALRPWLEAT